MSVITARKRSLRRLCFYTCLSFCSQGMGGGVPGLVPLPPGQAKQVHPPAGTPPGQVHPSTPQASTPLGRYTHPPPGQVHPPPTGMHPTGMHSCLICMLLTGLINMFTAYWEWSCIWYHQCLPGTVVHGKSSYTVTYRL